MGQFFRFLDAGPGPLSTMYQQYPTIALGPSDSRANSLGQWFRHIELLWRCLLWPPTPFQAEVWKWIQPAPRPYREGAKVSAELGVGRADWGSWPAGKLWKSWLSGVVYGGFMGFPRVDMLRFREDDATDPTDAPFGVPYSTLSVARWKSPRACALWLA